MKKHAWTPEQKQLVRDHYADTPTEILAEEIGCSVRNVYGMAYAMGLKKSTQYMSGPHPQRFDGTVGGESRFKPGHSTWNKGKKGWLAGGNSGRTRFKKGSKPHNHVPVGTLRVSKDGYLQQKLTDTGYPPRDWRSVHSIVWERANGPIPQGFVVIFKHGAKTLDIDAITPDALECLSRRDLMLRNSRHNNYPKEINQLIQLRGALQRQINKRSKA